MFEALSINCFHCQNQIKVKYVRAREGYSSKNNWEYWTGEEKNKDKYICDNCLTNLYYQHRWEFLQTLPKKKQTLLRQYLLNETIRGEIRRVFC